MKNKYTNLILVSLILIFSVLFYKDPFESKSEANPVTSIQKVSELNNNPIIEEEVKDGVYTNYTYGFSFEYDDNFYKYNSNPSYDMSGNFHKDIFSEEYNPYTSLDISVYRKSLNEQDRLFNDKSKEIPIAETLEIKEESFESTITKLNEFTFSNYSAFITYSSHILYEGSGSKSYNFVVENDEYLIRISVPGYKGDERVYREDINQISNSFIFIDSKLYRNEEYGFQFEYPASKFEESNEFNNEHNLKQWRLIQEDDESVYEIINLSAVAIDPYEKNSEMSTITTIDTIQKSGYSVDMEKWKTNENAGTDINIVYLARIKDENNSMWYEVRLVGSVLKEDRLSELEADFIRIANSFELTD